MKRRKLLTAGAALAAGSLVGFSAEAKMSQVEINNANKLIHTLKKTWIYQTPGYTPSHEYVVKLIHRALTEFNSVPTISFYSLADTEFIDSCRQFIADGAYRFWLAHTAIGLDKDIPTMSQCLQAQIIPSDSSIWHGFGMTCVGVRPDMEEWYEKAKKIKGSWRHSND